MAKLRSFGVLSALVAGAVALSGAAPAHEWVTVKGQVILPKAKIPATATGDETVTTDKAHCEAKGKLPKNVLVVNPKNDGVKNVVVSLRPDSEDRKVKFNLALVKPELAKAAPKEHVIDQPCCQFEPRMLAVRVGDTLVVKNSSPVNHNINYGGDPPFNETLLPGGSYKMKDPFPSAGGLTTFSCGVHPWMAGRIKTFEHPYFAVTDADGKFEIKDAPAGKFRVVYNHELGLHKGAAGAAGTPATLVGPVTQLEPITLELPPQK